MKKTLFLFTVILLTGCAQLHHVQLGEIQSSSSYIQKPFEIKISEVGVNLGEIKDIANATAGGKTKDQANDIADAIAMFQMGPRTGNPVYVKDYAKNLIQLIYEKCPSGKVTGLVSIRETRKYPVISGEIVKVTGYCLIPKGA